MRVSYLFFLLILLLCIILSIVLISLNAFNYKKGGYVLNKRGGTKNKAEIINSIKEIEDQLQVQYPSVNSDNIGEIITKLEGIQIASNHKQKLETTISKLLNQINNSSNFNKTINKYVINFNKTYPTDSSWDVDNINIALSNKQKQTGNNFSITDPLITQIINNIKKRNEIIDDIKKYKSEELLAEMQDVSNYKDIIQQLKILKSILYGLNNSLLPAEEKQEREALENAALEREALEKQEREALEKQEREALEKQEREALETKRRIEQEFNITAYMQDIESLSNSVATNIIDDIKSCTEELYKFQKINTIQSEEITLMDEIISELENDNKILSTCIEELHIQIKHLMDKITHLEIKLNKPILENTADKLELIELRKENTKLGTNYDLEAKRNALLDMQIASQNSNILKLQNFNKNLSRKEIELDKYKKLLKDKENDLSILEQNYQKNMSKIRENIDTLVSENESLKKNIQNIEENTYENLKGEFTKKFEEILVPIRDDNHILQKSNSRLGQNNSKLQKDNSNLQKDNSNLQKDNLELLKKNSRLKTKSSELEERSIELFDENDNLIKIKDELTRKNNTLEYKISKKNTYQQQAIKTIKDLTNELKRIKSFSI